MHRHPLGSLIEQHFLRRQASLAPGALGWIPAENRYTRPHDQCQPGPHPAMPMRGSLDELMECNLHGQSQESIFPFDSFDSSPAVTQAGSETVTASFASGKFAVWTIRSTDHHTYVFKMARMLRGGWYGAIPLPLHAQVIIKQDGKWYRLSSGPNGKMQNEAGASEDGLQELMGLDTLYVERYRVERKISLEKLKRIIDEWNTRFLNKYMENGNNCWDFADYVMVRLGVGE